MKTICVALLTAVLCVAKVHSLFCFRCENEPSNWNCMKSVKCAETDQFCITTTTTTGFGKNSDYRITKRCSPTCPENEVNLGLATVSTKCCSNFLCNVSGANGVKVSGAVMVVGIVASFFYVFRSGL